MSDRRFDDDEVREILARATEARDPAHSLLEAGSPVDGARHNLTLVELQDVAAEAGIPPARIAEAAAALTLDRAALPAPTIQLGVEISAAHVVRLPRMLEADEWDRFVVRLRDTFNAAGAVRTEGSLQTWSNGNLQVLLEPLEQGARLRFQSLHDDSKQYLDGGVVMVVMGLLMAMLLGSMVLFSDKTVSAALLFGVAASVPAISAGMWAMGRSKAAQWLPERRAQFRLLGEAALRVVGDGGAEKVGPADV